MQKGSTPYTPFEKKTLFSQCGMESILLSDLNSAAGDGPDGYTPI